MVFIKIKQKSIYSKDGPIRGTKLDGKLNLLISDNIIKANIFIVKFFPKIKIIDFNNIAIKAIKD